MSEDVNTYDEILAAARRFLETPETRQALERVGLTGDLTWEEEELLQRVAAFSEPIEKAGALRRDFMGFAQVLARRVLAGVIPSVESPQAHALVRHNARPFEYYWRKHGPWDPRDIKPDEFVQVMRELLQSREYIEAKEALDNFVFDEQSDLSFDDQRVALMEPADLKAARIRWKYGLPFSFQPTLWANLFANADDVPYDIGLLRKKICPYQRGLMFDPRDKRRSSIVEFPSDE